MNEGMAHQLSSSLEVFDDLADTFAANFLGTLPMSLLKETLVGDGRLAAFVTADGEIPLSVESLSAVPDCPFEFMFEWPPVFP